MEIKEAIERIRDLTIIHGLKEPRSIKFTLALNKAIESLEKQDKFKKGNWHITNAYPHWLCCGLCHKVNMYNVENLKEAFPKYCMWCGCEMDVPNKFPEEIIEEMQNLIAKEYQIPKEMLFGKSDETEVKKDDLS